MYVCTKDVCKHVYISVVFGSAKQEDAEMYIHSKTNVQIVAYLCSEVLQSNEDEYTHR